MRIFAPPVLAGAPTYTTLPVTGGSSTVNYQATAGTTLTASESGNSLKIAGLGSSTIALGANTLTLTSGGLLVAGSISPTISGSGSLKGASAARI